MKNFNMKNCIFGGSFIKKKMADIWNFDESNIWGKVYHI